MRTIPLDGGFRLDDRNDKLTRCTVERLVYGFGLQSATAKRSPIQMQISTPIRLVGLGLAHSLRILPLSVVSAWANTISTPMPLGEETLEHLRRTLIGISAVYGNLPVAQLCIICCGAGTTSSFEGNPTVFPSPGTAHGLAPIPERTWEATLEVLHCMRKS